MESQPSGTVTQTEQNVSSVHSNKKPNARVRRIPETSKPCLICGKVFTGRRNKVLCSPVCAKNRQRQQLAEYDALRKLKASERVVLCSICGVRIYPKGKQKYCGSICANEGLKLAIARQTERRKAKREEKKQSEK